MRVIKRLASGRFKAALLALTLCALVPLLSGCIFFGDYIKSELTRLGKVIRATGAQPQ